MSEVGRLRKGYALAREINRKHGKSYYWATQFFPPEKRRATHALYGFFRLADDIVDASDIVTPGGRSRARRELDQFCDAWLSALCTGTCQHPVLHAAAHVCRGYSIPRAYSERFLESMSMDITRVRYETYSDLSHYMYGSAACVGLMMSYVIGFTDCSALPHLANLGNAMQLTNFLRDVDEDYQAYGRVYLPLEDLGRFGLSEADIAERRYSQRWRDLMEYEAGRIRALYEDAELGIQLLSPGLRTPVRIAASLYGAILTKLRQKEWNVFAGRARTSTYEKLLLTVQAVCRT